MDDLIKNISYRLTLLKKISKYTKEIEKVEGLPPDDLSKLTTLKLEYNNISKIVKESPLDDSLRLQIEEKLKNIESTILINEKTVDANFGSQLDTLLKNNDMKLEGNFPKFKTSIYTLKIDPNICKVNLWYGNEQELLGTFDMVPKVIVDAIKKQDNRIKRREFDEEKFKSDLYKSYKMCLGRDDKTFGEAVLLTDIQAILTVLQPDTRFVKDQKKTNYREYDRSLFSYDLYRLKNRIYQNKELVLISATHAETKNRSGFIWVMENELGEGTPKSRLKFMEART